MKPLSKLIALYLCGRALQSVEYGVNENRARTRLANKNSNNDNCRQQKNALLEYRFVNYENFDGNL